VKKKKNRIPRQGQRGKKVGGKADHARHRLLSCIVAIFAKKRHGRVAACSSSWTATGRRTVECYIQDPKTIRICCYSKSGRQTKLKNDQDNNHEDQAVSYFCLLQRRLSSIGRPSRATWEGTIDYYWPRPGWRRIHLHPPLLRLSPTTIHPYRFQKWVYQEGPIWNDDDSVPPPLLVFATKNGSNY
jgi:hypothetical protein